MEQSKKREREKRFNRLYEKVKFEMELEGFVFTAEDREVIRKVYLGEMTREELIEQTKNNK